MTTLKIKRIFTEAEEKTNLQTIEHINQVRKIIQQHINELKHRAKIHDQSKLRDPEVQMFTKFGERLKDLEYGSSEYKKCLEDMGPVLQHHYRCNRHHPEHHERSIEDMNLIDVLEMLSDWKASTLRYKNGNIEDSIMINEKRFNICPQLISIMKNTVKLMDPVIKKKKVFLGGTCNGSNWRGEIIKYLEEANINYFNPVVDDWNEESQKMEIKERKNCSICLYTITPKMTGVYSIAEVIDDSHKRPESLILVTLKHDEDKSFDTQQWRSIQSVSKMVLANGGKTFEDLKSAVDSME